MTQAGEHFPPDYRIARERFRTSARRRGATLAGHPIETRAPDGDELTVDTAYLGPEAPELLLAISSGLHGVEGFAGSAVQHQLLALQLDGLALPARCGVLLVHALNPFGFSAIRRVNESNVDLNRNFVRHPDGHVPNPAYDELFDAINPETFDEETDAANRARLLAWSRAHGIRELQAVLTVGQYVHPRGVQFGGQREEESNRVLRRIAVDETRGAERIVWIDVHTGLGPFGEVELISESPTDGPDYLRARDWWGDLVKSTISGDSASAAVHGSIERGLAEALEGRELTAVAAEFGTYDPIRVFAAMRADNWLHHHGDAGSEQGVAIKRELYEVFRPAEPSWEERVLGVAASVIDRGRDGLCGTAPR